jgi:hypothetical protein
MKSAAQILAEIAPAAPPLNANSNGHHQPPPDADAIAAAVRERIEKDEQPKNPFPILALPKPIADIAQSWAKFFNLPCDYYVSSQLAAASGAIGNAFRVEFTYSYTEPLMLWNVIVGAPGIGKTPALNKGLYPLLNLQYQNSRQLETELAEYEIRKAAGVTPNKKPHLEQVVTENCTFEAMVKVLHANKRGVLGFHDEFMGFLKGMNAYKAQGGADLEQFLKIFNSGDLIVNRSFLDFPLHIRLPFITLSGGTQPAILHQLMDTQKMNVGLFGRCAWYYPDNQLIPLPSNVIPDPRKDDDWKTIIDNLRNLPTTFTDKQEPVILKMTDDGFKYFFDYKVTKEQETINKTEDENLKQVHIKQISYAIRLSGILELMALCSNMAPDDVKKLPIEEVQKIKVGRVAIEQAIAISDYLTANALKVIARTESPVAALPRRQRELYNQFPITIASGDARAAGEKLGMSESSVKRLLYNPQLFKQQADGNYRKLFT